MFRSTSFVDAFWSCFPHTRGDVPDIKAGLSQPILFSPHTWGCSIPRGLLHLGKYVFPTHVGMFLFDLRCFIANLRFPHTRGDVPLLDFLLYPITLFSPHTWGCSGLHRLWTRFGRVFPTHVGMFRIFLWVTGGLRCFPHTRGDVPFYRFGCRSVSVFSPHTWGCSVLLTSIRFFCLVFPTHVGMFRSLIFCCIQSRCFPHTRGDVPFCLRLLALETKFSPHTWGCSELLNRRGRHYLVFPTDFGNGN